MLVILVKDLRWSSIAIILNLYIDGKDSTTVNDIVNENDSCVFEFNHDSYQYLGKEDGVAKFKKLGSPDIIKPPFELTDKVTRIF